MNARERLIYDFEEDIVRRHATRLEGASPRLIAKTVEVGTNRKALRGEDIWAGAKFEVARLAELKQRLNSCKSKLDALSMSEWGPHTNFTSLTAQIAQHLRERLDAEFATIAFTKFTEILGAFPELLPSSKVLVTAHLCEAPGAFIVALNHHLATKAPDTSWSWVGNSLNPYVSENSTRAMIDDDRVIAQTKDRWYWGTDGTGNIMSVANIRGVWERLAQKVDLVTADGSVDSQDNPNEQESFVSALHYAEAVCALGCLKRGGSFVLKLFTFFEHATVGLLHVLASLFSRLFVCKPATSKSGNSEVYAVCIGFAGVDNAVLEKLLSAVDTPPSVALIDRAAIPPRFIDQLVAAAAMFAELQIAVIERNLQLFRHMPHQERARISDLKRQAGFTFCRHFAMSPLPSARRLLKQPAGPAKRKYDEKRAVVTREESEPLEARMPPAVLHQMRRMGYTDASTAGSGLRAPPTQSSRRGLGYGPSDDAEEATVDGKRRRVAEDELIAGGTADPAAAASRDK